MQSAKLSAATCDVFCQTVSHAIYRQCRQKLLKAPLVWNLSDIVWNLSDIIVKVDVIDEEISKMTRVLFLET